MYRALKEVAEPQKANAEGQAVSSLMLLEGAPTKAVASTALFTKKAIEIEGWGASLTPSYRYPMVDGSCVPYQDRRWHFCLTVASL